MVYNKLAEQRNSQNQSGFALVELLVGIIVILIISFGAYVYFSNQGDDSTVDPTLTVYPSVTTSPTDSPDPTSMPTPEPEYYRNVFFERDDYLYHVDPDTLNETQIVKMSSSFVGSEFGQTAFDVSPNNRYVAYVGQDDYLYVFDYLSEEIHQQVAVWQRDDSYWRVEALISHWSPDGTQLLYYLHSQDECPHCTAEYLDNVDNPNVEFGHHVYDVEAELSTYHPNLELPAIGWDNDSKHIFYKEHNNYANSNTPNLGIYSLETKTAETDSQFIFQHFPGQIYVSPVADVMVYSHADEGLDNSYLIIHNVTTNEITDVINDSWTANFRGTYNPTGEFILYKNDHTDKTYRYNVTTAETSTILDEAGHVVSWISDTVAVYYLDFPQDENHGYSDPRPLYLFDIISGDLMELVSDAVQN